MAYFSKLDSNNKVIDSIKVEDNVVTQDGSLNEEKGQAFLRKIFNEPDAVWKRSVKGMCLGAHKHGGEIFRKNHGGIGSTYDAARDAFIPPKTLNPDGTESTTVVFNEDTCGWDYPVSKPTEPANSVWEYGDIGGWQRIDEVSEGKEWQYNSTDGWVEVDI
jgi:hypothetical protein